MIDASTIERLLALPPGERLALVEALWDSLAADPDTVPVPDWHRDILEQRLAEDAADTSPGETWASVRRRIESGS
jgi:putative addiction module component (TIGR02574 family)